jgi:hypothetical protein
MLIALAVKSILAQKNKGSVTLLNAQRRNLGYPLSRSIEFKE